MIGDFARTPRPQTVETNIPCAEAAAAAAAAAGEGVGEGENVVSIGAIELFRLEGFISISDDAPAATAGIGVVMAMEGCVTVLAAAAAGGMMVVAAGCCLTNPSHFDGDHREEELAAAAAAMAVAAAGAGAAAVAVAVAVAVASAAAAATSAAAGAVAAEEDDVLFIMQNMCRRRLFSAVSSLPSGADLSFLRRNVWSFHVEIVKNSPTLKRHISINIWSIDKIFS